MAFRRISIVLLALALGVGLAGCGDDDTDVDVTTTEQATTEQTTTTEDDDTTTEEETTTTAAAAEGREIFTDNCGSCHVLADAGTAGTVGPDLDEVTLDVNSVAEQARNGGGGMPAFEDELSDEEIALVAAYVVEARR